MPAGCLIVGVLNWTPDSFSDGGRFATLEEVVEAGVAMVGQGAGWIDVGGGATRPGAGEETAAGGGGGAGGDRDRAGGAGHRGASTAGAGGRPDLGRHL